MSAIEQLETLTSESESQTQIRLGDVDYKIPVLKARHLAKAIKVMLPVEAEIMSGNFTVLYKDLDMLFEIVALFFDKTPEWAGDLTTTELHSAFAAVMEANPDFFVEVVAHLMARQ